MNESSICLLYNFAQHYRSAIFRYLDRGLACDFYFGDKYGNLKKMQYGSLYNFKGELRNIRIYKAIYWQRGAVSLFFKRYDKYIILGEYFCLSTWCILLLNFLFGRKRIFLWAHGWYGNEGFFKDAVKRLFFRLADGVFLYGNHSREMMIARSFSSQKLHVIFNSLDYDLQVRTRSLLTSSCIYRDFFVNSDPILIFVGRLIKDKKLQQLLESVVILQTKKIEVNVVFIGEGDAKLYLEAYAKENNLSNRVWFYGACYDELEIAQLMYNATLCVSPGSIGLTAMHALVYGTPVVTHNDFSVQGPEFESVKPGETGDFFIKDDVQNLAMIIEKWLFKLKTDREEVRKHCFEIIDKYYNPQYQFNVIKKALQ